MTGEELKRKLEATGVSQAKIAEMLGIFPQSLNKTLQADDVKSGLIEKLCQILDKDISFFYDVKPDGIMEGKFEDLRKKSLREEEPQIIANGKRVNGWLTEADVIERIKVASKKFHLDMPMGIDEGHLLVSTVLSSINNFPNLSAEWLMTGVGEMIIPSVGYSESSKTVIQLREENAELRNELERVKSLKLPTKDSKIYNLWMKFMEITEEMQELYKEEKGE